MVSVMVVNAQIETEVAKDTIVTAIDDFELSTFKVYPNPSNGVVFIEAPSNTEIRSMDIYGKEVDLNEVSAGIYFVEFTYKRQKQVVRVIKI